MDLTRPPNVRPFDIDSSYETISAAAALFHNRGDPAIWIYLQYRVFHFYAQEMP